MSTEFYYDFITPSIAVGGVDSYRKDILLFNFRLNVAFEIQRWPQDHPWISKVQNLMHVPLDDSDDMERVFRQAPAILTAVDLLTEAVEEGRCCLVTCLAGRNRSALVVAEHLIQKGMAPDSAIATLQTKRKNTLGNEAFVAWLKRARNSRDL